MDNTLFIFSYFALYFWYTFLYFISPIFIIEPKNIDLALKVKRKARNKKGIKNKKIYGTSISQRPQYIEQRQKFGHWERDTVQGKKKKGEVIISLVERKTRYSIFVKVNSKDNESIKQGLRDILKEYEKTTSTTPIHTQHLKEGQMRDIMDYWECSYQKARI